MSEGVEPDVTAAAHAKLQYLGRRLVMQLYMVIRTSRIHEPGNKALVQGTENLRLTINTLLGVLGSIRIQFVEDLIYFNDVRLRVDASIMKQMEELRVILTERELGGLSFNQAVDAAYLRDFLVTLGRPVRSPEDVQSIRQALGEMKNLALELLGPRSFSDGEQDIKIDRKTFSLQTYAKAVVGARECVQRLKDGVDPMSSRLHLRRIVQDLVDIATERVNFLLKVSAIKTAADYPYNHAANTCVLAIVIGKALKIDRLQLVELGLSAFLADMGFWLLPEEELTIDRAFSDQERQTLLASMKQKVRLTIGKGRLSAPLIRRMLVAYEHHTPYRDGATKQRNHLHVFSRIVALADAYDALTTRRPWREAYPPDEALRLIVQEADQRFDPTMVKILVNLLGLYPLGSLLRLESGELAVVYHNSNDPTLFEKPWVKVVKDASGLAVRKTVIRNLAQEDGPGGQIQTTVRADEMKGFDPAMSIIL
jgi:HD-GYP domain-containing protein (c-di-GMP phosphodiesterase class II)